MANIVALKAANADRWAKAKLTRAAEFQPVARRLVASKARFQALEAKTGVPWFIIAVIKERESGVDATFLRNIANGQVWSAKTTIVPKGRGPFKSWEDAAIDALVNCAPNAARNQDWSVGGALTLLEQYNGLGYAGKGLPSPYIWSGTDRYSKGKYVSDGVFDPNKVDEQLGCAGILMAMAALDTSIQFGAHSNVVVLATKQPYAPAPNSTPSISNRLPARSALGSHLSSKKQHRKASPCSGSAFS